MFTGLVEDLGKVSAVTALPSGQGRRLYLESGLFAEPIPLGASVCTDGVCLTVTDYRPLQIVVEVGPETLSRTTLGAQKPGDLVHLERALRLSDRLGGHLVSGHVDAVGQIARATERGEAVDVYITIPKPLLRYVIEKGSIAVDGISLTVNQVDDAGFSVSLIPHTQSKTTLSKKSKEAGRSVNIEVDLIGKYVEKLLGGTVRPPSGGLTLETLKEHGYVRSE